MWINIFLIFFLATQIIVYSSYSIESYLWLCKINLFLTIFGILFKNKLLISMAFVGGLARFSIWNLSFIINLFTNYNLFNVTAYIFSLGTSLTIKIISLYHIFLPIILIFFLKKIGYDSRAFIFSTILYWFVIIITYFFTIKSNNINFVFCASTYNWSISDQQWVIFLLIFEPILFILPVHFFCKYKFK
jgi:hypothetical protein